jgi:hypothetical protein
MTLVILTIIWGAYRFHRAMVWPVLWIACFTAPVLPVFASSHHLYLPSVGTVLLLTAGLAALGGLTRRAASGDASAWRPTQVQKVVCGLVLLAHAVGLGLLTWASGFAYQAGTRTEDILIDEVLRRSKPIRDGDHFFFINMPVLAYYALPAIEARIDRRDLHGHVLTFSPWLMRMEKPGTVEVLDRHRLRVRAAEDHPYFEAVTGNTLLLAMGFEGVPAVGVPIRADGFTVTPLAANERGITEIEFAFDRPIDSPDYHFYFGSPHFLAYPLQMPEFTSTAPSH